MYKDTNTQHWQTVRLFFWNYTKRSVCHNKKAFKTQLVSYNVKKKRIDLSKGQSEIKLKLKTQVLILPLNIECTVVNCQWLIARGSIKYNNNNNISKGYC